MKETSEQRSRTMRAVKDRNTKPELAVRSIVHKLGYRFRLHRKDLPGKPDLVLPRLATIVFVHGLLLAWAQLPSWRARAEDQFSLLAI